MKRARSVGFGVSLAALAIALAPTADANDFLPTPEIVDAVLSASPTVRAGIARIDEAEGEARRLAAGPYEWRVTTTYAQRDVLHVGQFNEYETSLSRAVRLPGKARLDRNIGKLGVTAAEQSAEDARHQSALLLLDYWMNWLVESEKTSIAAAQAEAWQATLRIVQRRVELGQTPTIEAELARSAVAEIQTTRLLADGASKSAQARLQSVFPDMPLPAAAPAVPSPEPLEHAALYEEQVISASHEIGFWQSESERLGLQARRAGADRLPDPELGLRALSERNGEETALGFTISVPLGGGARSAILQRDQAAARAAKLELDRVRMQIRETARTNLISVETEHAAWQSARVALDNSQSAIERLRRGFVLQVSSLAELQIAERRHGEIRLMEAEARGRANRAALKALIDAHEMWID